jgi:hypothetical protein
MTDLSTTGLRPNPFPAEEDGEFVRFENVPLFDEHVGDDGVHYDENLLNCIAENNNRRCADTGDFVPIVVGHTSDEPNAKDPPVIGLAGPFHVAPYGKVKPRPCIHATFWVWKEHADEFRKKYPRRSVEVWPEDSPEQRYFDPIAVLGAETPKRDLGLVYGKPKNGKSPFRYSMGSPPGGSNTFLPSTGDEKQRNAMEPLGPMPTGNKFLGEIRDISAGEKLTEKGASFLANSPSNELAPWTHSDDYKSPGFIETKEKHSKGQDMALSPEDIQAIVSALEPMIDAKLAQQNVSGVSDELDDVAPADMDGGVEGGSIVGKDDTDPMAAAAPSIEETPPGEVPPDAPPPVESGPPTPDANPWDDDDKDYAKGLYARYSKLMKSSEEEAQKYMGGLGEEDAQLFQRYAKECGDESMNYDKGMDEGEFSTGGGDSDHQFSGASDMSDKAEHYQKRAEDLAAKYRKLEGEHGSLKQKYQKAQEEIKTLTYAKRKADRKQRLHSLQMEGFAFDLDDELFQTIDYSDDQFDRHETNIRVKYQKAPIGISLNVVESPEAPQPQVDERAKKYSEKAKQVCLHYMKKGVHLDYGTVLRNVKTNGGEYVEREAKLV